MATIRELVIKFGFDVDEAPLKKMEKGIEDLKAGFLAISAAAAAAAASIFGIAKSTANYADQIQDTAMSIGISQSALQEMAYAAQLSGGSFEILSDGLRLLSRTAYEASNGMETYAEAYRTIGVSVKDVSGKIKAGDRLLLEIADKFKTMPNGVEKTALAMDLFGRSGVKLIPFLNSGSAAIGNMSAEARDLGIVMDDEAIQAGSEFNDAVDSVIGTVKGLVRIVGSGLIPLLKDLTLSFREWIKQNRELIKSRMQNFVEILVKYLKGLWRVLSSVYYVLRTIIVGIDKTTKSIGGFITVLKTLAGLIGLYFVGRMAIAIVDVVKGFYAISKAAVMAWRSVALGPILIGAAIAAAFLVIEDLIAWLDGRPSVLGFLIKNKDEIINKIQDFLDKVLTYTEKILKIITVSFLEFFGVPADEAEAAFDAIARAFKKLVSFLAPHLKRFASFMKNEIGNALKNMMVLAQALAQGFVALVTNPKQALTDLARMFGETIKGAILSLIDSIKNLSNTILSLIGFNPGMFLGAWQAFEAMIGNIVDTIFGYIIGLKDIFIDGFRGIVNAVTKLFQGDFLGFFATLGNTILNVFIGIFSNIFSFIGNIISNVFTGVTDMIINQATEIGNKIKGLIVDPIKNMFGGIAAKLGIDFESDNAVSQIQSAAKNPFAGITPASTISNMNNQSSNTEIKSTINVTVPPGSDANAVGEAVRRAASEEFARILRPAARATKSTVSY